MFYQTSLPEGVGRLVTRLGRLDDRSEVYTGNQKPEGRISVSRAHVLRIYVYGGIVLVRMSVSVKLEHSYSNGGEGSVLIVVSPFQRLLETGAQSIYMYIHM